MGNKYKKRSRIFNVLASFTNKHQCGNHVIQLINYYMNPLQHGCIGDSAQKKSGNKVVYKVENSRILPKIGDF